MSIHLIVEGVILAFVVGLYWWAFKKNIKDDD